MRHDDLGWLCYFCDVATTTATTATAAAPAAPAAPVTTATATAAAATTTATANTAAASITNGAASSVLQLTPRDSYRRRVYVAPLGLLITSDGGVLERVDCTLSADGANNVTAVTVVYAAVGTQPLAAFRLRLEARAGGGRAFGVAGGHPKSRGSWQIAPASSKGAATAVELTW